MKSTPNEPASVNLDSSTEMRFPIRLPIETDESGQGYVLRLGALNGFGKARQILSGRAWGSMPSELDAEVVSRWFG